MDKSDEEKKIALGLLKIEEEQEVAKMQQKLQERGFFPGTSGEREVGLIRVKYALKRQAIENGIDLPIEDGNNHKAINPQITKRSPFLKDLGKKNRPLRRLEALFINKDKAPFNEIAKKVGFNKTLKEYRLSQRQKLINLQKLFNKYSKKAWGVRLETTHGVQGIIFDGLVLVSTTN